MGLRAFRRSHGTIVGFHRKRWWWFCLFLVLLWRVSVFTWAVVLARWAQKTTLIIDPPVGVLYIGNLLHQCACAAVQHATLVKILFFCARLKL